MNSIDEHEALVQKCQQRIDADLKPSRAEHTRNVAKEAIRLANKYGADPKKAEIAALLHDIARNLPMEEMNRRIRRLGLEERYINNKNLSHSKLAVEIMEQDFGIRDRELLDAVAYHTTGRRGMTLLDKIIFLADAIEPGREYPGVEKLRELTEQDLDQACAYSLRRTKEFIESKGEYLDPDTAEGLEFCEEEIEKKGEHQT